MSNTSTQLDFLSIGSEDTVPLRHSVLWPTYPVSHVVLPSDASSFHFGAFVPDSPTPGPVAVISVFIDPIPSSPPDSPAAAHFFKFACDPAFQGKGIGTQLLLHVFGVATTDMECAVIWCDARLTSAVWYERRGMTRFGDTFFKSGVEYVRMKRVLEETGIVSASDMLTASASDHTGDAR